MYFIFYFFQSALSILFVFSGDVGTLIDFFSFAIWTFYGLTFLSTIVLRWRRPLMERPFKVKCNSNSIYHIKSVAIT